MNGGSQVHIFWGAPVSSSEMTVPQESTFLTSTTDSWEKIQLFYDQHSLHQKDEECKHNLEYDQVADAVDPTNTMNRSVDVKDKFLHCISETQDLKSEKTHPFEINVTTNSDVQICEFKNIIRHLTEEEKCQKHFSEIKKITSEQHKDQSNICGQNFQNNSFQLDHKFESLLDLECDAEHIKIGPGVTETKCISAEHHKIENESLKLFSSNTVDKLSSTGSVKMVSDRKISADTEFLSIMTSSQVAFLTQKKYERQNFTSKEAINLTESKASDGEVRVTEEKLTQPKDDLAEGREGEQTQAYSLELFSPVYPDTKSCHSHIESDKDLKGNTASHQVFTSEDKVPPNEMYIESYNSGILYSQKNTCHKSSVKRRCTSQDKMCVSKAQSEVLLVTKKIKLVSSTRDSAVAVNQKTYGLKGVEKTSLIKDCFSKSQKYNCLVMVLSPCHVKEITIKSGPNSGSKVPLATIVVIDQSEIQKKVFLWRTAAFWALTLFLGDIILLTDVTIHEDQWVGDTVLQSTFTSELLNLGNYSSVQPEEYSTLINGMVLQDLLLYVSSKHSYLRDLPQRQPQRMNRIEFVELEQLQPDILVHAVLRVVDITILTEALYSYRGQKQRKVMLTVEQTQGQHYVLVLWGPGAAWYPQLQRKKDYIWEFKYLYVQRNCILRKLELHTTYWSSCECLFDDDVRAITFKAKFPKDVLSLVKMSDLASHLDDKYSGVILIKARIIELLFPVTSVQKITLNADSSLKSIYFSLPNTIYTGCAKCETELEIDENKIYKQCFSCLPLTMKKIYYRSALMTITDGKEKVCIHVGSKMIEKILLNIPPDWHNKIIAPSSEVTYGMVVADLFHSLVADSGTPCRVKMQSLFVLDENSYPLQREFSLLGFYPDSPVK